jgi:hypothetical protein
MLSGDNGDDDVDYVEIDRHVRDLGDDGPADSSARRWLRARRSDTEDTLTGLVQADTLQPVVLIAPSGTGKTTEFRQQARRLRSSGRAAVFADASAILATLAMDLGDERVAFEHLLQSKTPGVLFIDALDELYLRQQTLEQLFRGLERAIDFAAHPTRLIFSARNGAWTSSATRELRRLLKRVVKEGSKDTQAPKLVAFEPLDIPSIKKLAAAYGVEDVDEFALEFEEEEIDDLLDLRPADVKLLAKLRKRGGRLSKWTDLLREYIDASFIEERPDRSRAQRLSVEVGRRGLQRAAAAAMLMRVPHISTSSAIVVEGAISSRQLFADWSASELTELFENPLFVHKGCEAEAVQLPQGPISYYLAARWFAERVQAGLPDDALRKALLVKMAGDDRIEIPKVYRKVIGWLSSEVPAFRKLIIRDHPSIVLCEGDPDRLSDPELRAGLGHLCEAIASGRWDGWATPATFLRLARASVEGDVKALLERYKKSSKVLVQVLKLVEHGKYRTCADLTLELAAKPPELIVRSAVRSVAITAFAAAAPDERSKLVAFTSDKDEYVRTALLRALVPDLLQGSALVTFIAGGGGHVFGQGLSEVADEFSTSDLDAIIAALESVLSNPMVTAVTAGAFKAAVPIAMARLERGGTVDPCLVAILSAIERLMHFRGSMDLAEEEEQAFRRSLEFHDEIRRELWIRRFQDAARSQHSLDGILHPHFGDAEARDLKWLWDLYCAQPPSSQGTFHVVLQRVWDRLSCSDQSRVLDEMGDLGMKALLTSWLENEQAAAEQRRKHEEAKLRKEEAQRKSNEEAISTRRANIESGIDLEALKWALQHLEGPSGENAKLNPERLLRYVGEDLAAVFLRGLRACWRKIDPPVPESGQDVGLRDLGLTGLTLAVRAGLDLSTLSQEDARRAARFGLYELNAFPFWYVDLARTHAGETRLALQEILTIEWTHKKAEHGVLRFASRSEREISEMMRSIVLELLEMSPPRHAITIDYAVDTILTSTTEMPRVRGLVRREIDRSGTGMPDPHWLRIWAHVEPEYAAEWITKRLDSAPAEAMPALLKTAKLLEEDLDESFGRTVMTSLMSPKALGRWARLMLSHVKPTDDAKHHGPYAPSDLDHAQDLRNRFITRLAAVPTPEARGILFEMQSDPALAFVRPLLDRMLERQHEAAVEASITQWTEEDILRLERKDEKHPRTLEELRDLVTSHLHHVHNLVANHDFSYRNLFKSRGKDKTKEREIQLWAASCLFERARGLYTVVRENVVDDDKEIDISAFAAGVGHIPIEIKPLGDYSARALEEIMEKQLLGQYMQPPDRRYGVLLLVRRDERRWRLAGKEVELEVLVEHLRSHAQSFGTRHGKILSVAVIDLLARPAGSTAATSKKAARRRRRTKRPSPAPRKRPTPRKRV